MNDQVDDRHGDPGEIHRIVSNRSRPLRHVSLLSSRCSWSTVCSIPMSSTRSSANFEHNLGPLNGAKVVARAWVDPAYRPRLLTDGTAAIAELGFGARKATTWWYWRTLPRAQPGRVHVVFVLPVAGSRLAACVVQAPAYRSRAVREPRLLLAEMGTTLPDDIEIHVWDSSAEVRYLVLPQRPSGTENLSEEELATLVTRDSMVGVQRL